MAKLPVSVHILTWNSGRTLERALTSVKDCAEILIIDGGSTDDTLAIAEQYGARVLPQRFPGAQGKPLDDFAAARNVGLEHATQLWILSLDSDEEMSPEAMKEIKAATERNTVAAFWVPRHYMLEDGTIIEHASTYPNERVYFFRRDVAEKWEKPVHERIILKEGTKIDRFRRGSVATLPPLSIFKSKFGQYLRIEQEQSRGKGWIHWLKHRVLHTVRSRVIAILRLLRIWVLPQQGKRLPFAHEMVRFWYAWKLIVMTCPLYPRPHA